MRLKTIALALVTVLTICGTAMAGAVDDGNAGLEALNAGDFDKAIALFTRALNSGQLTGDDKEFAYLNRGKAYAAKHNYVKAVADLKQAVRINPADDDAKAALAEAQASRATGSALPSRPSRGWGALASLAGRYFWMNTSGQKPNQSFVAYDWSVPQQILHFTIRSKDDVAAVGQYRLDPATGEIAEVEALSSALYYGTSTQAGGVRVDYYFINSVPLRSTTAPAGTGFHETDEKFVDGAWQNFSTTDYVETNEAELRAAGFLKK
jgi:tetratricopeptide (TPR) repeat protein